MRFAGVEGAKAVARKLVETGHGVQVLTGGTDVHLALVDLRDSELTGQDSEDRLHDIGITVNRNAVPDDPRPPMVTSGLRVGTSALATRGLGEDDLREVGRLIAATLQPELRYDQVVTALGGAGETVTRAGDLADALKRGFESGVPYLVNVITDPADVYPRSSLLA